MKLTIFGQAYPYKTFNQSNRSTLNKFTMPGYKLLISFEVKPPEGDSFHDTFDEIREFKDINSAENELDVITSTMISRFSDQGYEWTILEKCVVLQTEQKESDLTALML